MITRKFTVPGEPKGKMRPRASSFGGHAKVYAPKEQIEYENWIRSCYCARYGEAEKLKGPISASIMVFMGIPKSATKKARQAMLDGDIVPTKKPDLDNMVKQLDALNGIAFGDDSAIYEVYALKLYSENPRVEFELKAEDGE